MLVFILSGCSGGKNTTDEIASQKAHIVELEKKVSDQEKELEELKNELSKTATSEKDVDDSSEETNTATDSNTVKDGEAVSAKQMEDKLLLEFYKQKFQDSNLKDEIVFGFHEMIDRENYEVGSNRLLGSSAYIINSMLQSVDWQGDANKFEGNYDNIIKERIQNEEGLATIKQLANKKYSFYNLEQKIMETKGYVTMGGFENASMVFDNPKEEGLFISGDYDHMPRPITVKINTVRKEDSYDRYDVVQYDETVNTNEIIKAIGLDMEGLSITQLIECDIDGDNKMEKIVNINNSFENDKYIIENYTDIDYTDYMVKIVILNENNEIITTIEEFIPRNNGAPPLGELFAIVHYVIDADNDGTYEIISETPTWEGTHYIVNQIDIKNKSLSQSKHYEGL